MSFETSASLPQLYPTLLVARLPQRPTDSDESHSAGARPFVADARLQPLRPSALKLLPPRAHYRASPFIRAVPLSPLSMPELPLARIDPALLSVSQQEQQRQQLADETSVPSTSRKRRRPQRASVSGTTSYEVADSDGSGSDAAGDDDEYQLSDASSPRRRRSSARGGGQGTNGSGDDEGEEDARHYMQPSLVKTAMMVKKAKGRNKGGGKGARRGISKQQRRLQEALARSGKSLPVGGGAEAEGKAKSCECPCLCEVARERDH